MTVERLSVAEIAQSSLAAVRVLERHGIDYCAASRKSLQEVCLTSDLPLEVILEELSNADPSDLEDRDWTSVPLREVIHFLVVTDHSYIRAELEVLSRRLLTLVEEQGAQPLMAHLPRIFTSLREDLETHMMHEEQDVFPAIEQYLDALDAGQAPKASPLALFGGPLRLMDNEHETTGAALRLMRDFAHDYQAPSGSSLRYRALVLGLQALEDRLLRHIYIENNVLFPRAAALKSSRVEQTTASVK